MACVLALAAPPAGAQDPGASPSARELWEAYPLHPSPEPGTAEVPAPSPTAAGAPARAPGSAAPRSDGGGVPTALLVLLPLLAAAAALAFAARRRRRATTPRPAPSLLTAAGRAAALRAFGVRARQRIAESRGGQRPSSPRAHPPEPDAAAPEPVAGSPPDLRRAWTVEIEWRQTDVETRFCAIARDAEGGGTEVAQSPPLEWPPAGPKGVQELNAAADALEALLVGAGWKPLPPGDAWYAKRFAWEPAPAKAAPARRFQPKERSKRREVVQQPRRRE